MDSSIEVTVNKILARTSEPMNENVPRILRIFGAGVAMGYHNLVSGRSKDSDVSPIIATSEAPEFDVDKFVNLLDNNQSKIDFLVGYAEKLAQTDRVKEAVILANRYMHIRNSEKDYEDIISVFRAIFPDVWISELSELNRIKEYTEAC